MTTFLKSGIIVLFLIIGVITSTQAELFLYKLRQDGTYSLVTAETYAQEQPTEQKEIETIFQGTLMKYQWPMITIHFYDLPKSEQESYLDTLKKEHGVTVFIQQKIDETFGKDTYKVRFVPTTIFELAAINSFMKSVILSPKEPQGDSIFPQSDFRSGNPRFSTHFSDDLVDGLRQYSGQNHADLKALKIACDRYNQSEATFEMYLQTCSYLNRLFKNTSFRLHLDRNILSLVSDHYAIKDNFEASMVLKHKRLLSVWEQLDQHHNKYFEKTKYLPLDDDDTLTNTLIKGVELDIQAEAKSNFILYRGTGGLQINESSPESRTDSPYKQSFIIDSPYRESVADYEEALKDWPETLKKSFLSVEVTKLKNKGFYPKSTDCTAYSLSYGNSLMAGTFLESAANQGARALDYIIKGYGYALTFPIRQFFNDPTKPSLQQKYYISALHPLVALFSVGEFFHSRSKISLIHPTKKGCTEEGIKNSHYYWTLLGVDKSSQGGLIITPDVYWSALHASISHDIAAHSIWIKSPPNAASWGETQKNFALFSSFEVAAFKDYFLKFKPVLAQIESLPSRPLQEDTAINPKPTLYGTKHFQPHQTLAIPVTPPDKLRVTSSHILEDIMKKEKPLVESAHSFSIDNAAKRTLNQAYVFTKGPYITFSHFTDFASPEEIVDILRSAAQTASTLGIDQTGYRIITNNSLNPGGTSGNDAGQHIPQFHFDVAGGECLGNLVEPLKGKMDFMSAFADEWTFDQLYQYAMAHKVGERHLQTQEGKKIKFVAYRIVASYFSIKDLIGFLMLDDKRQSIYPSFHEFAKYATAEEILGLFSFINDTARYLGLYESGFRLISNTGNDAHQYPKNVMSFVLAGGTVLGESVSNMYGNRDIIQGNLDYTTYDFAYLKDYPHEHCSPNTYDTRNRVFDLKTEFPQQKNQTLLDLSGLEEAVLLQKLSSIAKPSAVSELNLSDNSLEEIPDSFFNLFTRIRKLDLRRNSLKELPDTIGQLAYLKILLLNDNQLTTLPDSIGQLTYLEGLDLRGNDILDLPKTLENLKNSVKIIDLRGNKNLRDHGENGRLGKIDLQNLFGEKVKF